MPSYPKLSRKTRLAEETNRKRFLKAYRQVNKLLAIHRDSNLCAVCFFLHDKKKRADDVHHVYGRGQKAGDWRERYINLLCVCREHHPLPIQIPKANDELVWIEDVLVSANENPINPDFKHSEFTLDVHNSE